MFQIVSFSKRGKITESKFVFDYFSACEVSLKLSTAIELGYYVGVSDSEGQYWFVF